MAIAYNVGALASKTYDGPPVTGLTTGAITTTGGSGSVFLLFTYHEQSGEGFTSVSDSKTNSWTQVGSTLNNGNHYTRVYKCEGGTGGSGHTFTNLYSSAAATALSVVELTGCATSNAVDQSTGLFDNATPFNSGSTSTTAQAAEMLVGYFRGDGGGYGPSYAVDSSSNPTSGWTIRLSHSEDSSGVPNCIATATVSSTGAYNVAFTETGSGEGHVIIVTVKEATATQSNAPRAVHLMKLMRG